MIFMLCSIYISIALMPCFLHEHPWRGWSCQKNLHPFLYKCSLLAWSSPTLLVAPFSHMYFYTLSFHFLSGILLLLDFLHKLLTLPSPNMSKPSQSVSVHPFHHSTSHSVCMSFHTTSYIHAFITFTIPHVTPHAPPKQLISTTHTLDCWAQFTSMFLIHTSKLARACLYLHVHNPPLHNPYKKSCYHH